MSKITAPPGEGGRLQRTIGELVHSSGRDPLARADGLAAWRDVRLRAGMWPWGRSLEGAIGPRVTVRNEVGMASYGLNFVTQDPLALLSHPTLFDAALDALQRFGPHSAGSPCFAGASIAARTLESALAELLGREHVLLFPSGWAAGFGTLQAIVRPTDHVVIDAAAHPSLQAGAAAATRQTWPYGHCDVAAATAHLRAIRARDATAAIVVVTETLFAFESDGPDLGALQAACRAHDAVLLAACGHDLGTMGPGGTGVLGLQQRLADVDLVIGTFAKAFATNGGFLATRSADVKQWVRFAASSHAHSNALAPAQAAVATEAIRIVRSEEGERLRVNLADAVAALRDACGRAGLAPLGLPSALVPIPVESVGLARVAEALAADRGVLVTPLEAPFVAAGTARLALHVMASHRPDQARDAAELLARAVADARRLLSASSDAPLP
jgi:glycine C-acetyltransferase/8-amino-7-oxononanoate synthase